MLRENSRRNQKEDSEGIKTIVYIATFERHKRKIILFNSPGTHLGWKVGEEQDCSRSEKPKIRGSHLMMEEENQHLKTAQNQAWPMEWTPIKVESKAANTSNCLSKCFMLAEMEILLSWTHLVGIYWESSIYSYLYAACGWTEAEMSFNDNRALLWFNCSIPSWSVSFQSSMVNFCM